MVEARQKDAQARALLLTKAIKRRDDLRIRTLIEGFTGELVFSHKLRLLSL